MFPDIWGVLKRVNVPGQAENLATLVITHAIIVRFNKKTSEDVHIFDFSSNGQDLADQDRFRS